MISSCKNHKCCSNLYKICYHSVCNNCIVMYMQTLNNCYMMHIYYESLNMSVLIFMIHRTLFDYSNTFLFSQEEYEMVYRTIFDEVQTTSRQL